MASRVKKHPGRDLVESYTSRQRQKDATRERIAKAALEVFQEQGFLGATIEEVAKRASVSRPTVYFHFKDKLDLANEIGIALYPETEKVILALGTLDPDDTAAVGRWLRRFTALQNANAPAISVAVQANTSDTRLAQDLVDIYGEHAETIVRTAHPDEEPDARRIEIVRVLLLTVDRYLYVTRIQKARLSRKWADEAFLSLVQSSLRSLRAKA